MGRSPMAEIPSQASDDNGDLSFHAVRGSGGGFPVKRNHHLENPKNHSDDLGRKRWRNRPHLFRGGGRKGFQIKGTSLFYAAVAAAVFIFLVAATMLQSSMTAGLRSGRENRWRSLGGGFMRGTSLRFTMSQRFATEGSILDQLRMEGRSGIRLPTLAIIYAIEDDEAHPLWDQIGCRVSILGPEIASRIDWSIYDGVVLSSLEAKEAISSLMQEPFCSVPLIWIVQEDTLGKRLPTYTEMGWEHLIMEWRRAFNRADVVVFPDYTLPMLYSVLDTGNFFVISGSPVDAWTAEHYIESHSKNQLRKENGFHDDDLVILVIGTSLFYNELPWDYAVVMHAIGPLLTKAMRAQDLRGSFEIVFLCGNSTDGYRDALQEIASHLGFPDGSVSHYGMDVDVNSVLLMADIVLYGSFQEEQGFPPLLIRAMSFEVPIIAPDLAIIKRYVVNGVHGLIFQAREPETLTRAFSILVSDMKLSKFAHVVASSGKLLARNILASECITGYAKLLENVLQFPSDSMLPGPISQLQKYNWEWNLFRKKTYERGTEFVVQNIDENRTLIRKTSIVYVLEEELASDNHTRNTSEIEIESTTPDHLTQLDWDEMTEIESSEELERREMQEIEERMEKPSQSWDEIYRNARKAEKLKSEVYERDEGELERMGQSLCIYEIYNGAGAWPFLHRGALYRGLSLSTRARRSRSDDVDAVLRLPFLNDTYYKDLLCEIGGMFSIAKEVDSIHNIPWIGFQSWRAVGRRVSLSKKAEKMLEETIQLETKGDIFYYWARTDRDNKGGNVNLSFWSLCDILNGGNCRAVFEKTLRQMYSLPLEIAALPPMPDDGHLWSALHSWAMPTPSFLEFVMFSRIFIDSLDGLNHNLSSTKACLLGSSKLQEKHCYCRMLELLVNVWAYHSARKMVYIDPNSGLIEEQHPIEGRKGLMWVRYFNFTLLKSMDEDLAEEADDEDHQPNNRWLWPLTGEVHWQGVYEREREERYRQKMDKKRKTKEKILERHKYGYKQKTLGG
ncbi:uncharacterized protein LOC131231146 isoform X2 [Magnolia sinica]|uniref:uncharacterized protein LOC131231146 isoform X2 n=1 Tax=Magnolia sinica TaxID=86752 RepID=UPI002659A012|nr:uncharacterized protein LOC131231146 isoform X2 [Magnolia sinica]